MVADECRTCWAGSATTRCGPVALLRMEGYTSEEIAERLGLQPADRGPQARADPPDLGREGGEDPVNGEPIPSDPSCRWTCSTPWTARATGSRRPGAGGSGHGRRTTSAISTCLTAGAAPRPAGRGARTPAAAAASARAGGVPRPLPGRPTRPSKPPSPRPRQSPPAGADRPDAGRDLLYGLIALQNGLIDQDQLVAAFRAWVARQDAAPGRPSSAPAGPSTPSSGPLLEPLVGAAPEEVRGRPGQEAWPSLAAGRSTRERLARLGDAELEATLDRVGAGTSPTEPGSDEADRTATFSVGATTCDGQRFRVLRPHARGGLGAVFVALDAELNREVALKQIHDRHADDPTSRQRFLIEAEITGGLEHPGIVPVYGLGTYADGRPYYAMRFIRGDSLKEAIERFHADEGLKQDAGRRSLELRKLLRRFLDVCNAIDYAHSRGVLHRDIKPGNIIVGKHGETLVVDWGLAKATGRGEPGGSRSGRSCPARPAAARETLPGTALGTPAYMSPEQAAASSTASGRARTCTAWGPRSTAC